MCRFCKNYNTCTALCSKVLNSLYNSKKTNNTYSDSTVEIMSKQFEPSVLDNILYTTSLSEETYSRVQKVVIAVLTPEQKALLYLVAQGKNQQEIGDILQISQSGVSQKLKTIKRELKKQFTQIIDTIL